MRYRMGKRCVRLSPLLLIGGVGIALVIFDYNAHTNREKPVSNIGAVRDLNATGAILGGHLLQQTDGAQDKRAATNGDNRIESDSSTKEPHASIPDSYIKVEKTAEKTTSAIYDNNASFKHLTATPHHSTTVGSLADVSNVDSGANRQEGVKFSANTSDACYHSPYFVCDRSPVSKAGLNRTFHVAYLSRPYWQRASVYDFSRCRYSNCVYQEDKITEDTDVVLVYGVRLYDSFTPPKRWPHQLYAFAVWEPPDRIGGTFITNSSSVWNHAFNLTFTYRLDSDIPAVYFRLKPNPRPQDKRPNYYEIAKQKNRTAVWFVSRCFVPSRRAQYVREMQKYIDVDIYGKCGKKCTVRGDACTELFPQYKFYLSFENSLCTDYITEKLFKNFVPDKYIIPVVRGGGSYDKYFPEGMFINAANFKSPKDLALHLKELGSSPVKYSKYLERKDSYVIGEVIHEREAGCELCQYLNTRAHAPKVYDMKQWYGDGHCKRATEISWPS